VGVELSTTIDCIPVDKTGSLLTFGLSFSDVVTKDPITKTPLGMIHWVDPRPTLPQSTSDAECTAMADNEAPSVNYDTLLRAAAGALTST
jgi:hypothetical protein